MEVWGGMGWIRGVCQVILKGRGFQIQGRGWDTLERVGEVSIRAEHSPGSKRKDGAKILQKKSLGKLTTDIYLPTGHALAKGTSEGQRTAGLLGICAKNKNKNKNKLRSR
jgi:hypothetical protein